MSLARRSINFFRVFVKSVGTNANAGPIDLAEHIYEEDADGTRRAWAKSRDGDAEDPTERKKWLVIAILKKR